MTNLWRFNKSWNLYTFIMYINLKLFSFKLNNNITTYEDLLKKINELDISNNASQNELSLKTKKIFKYKSH
jgi:hypothetical protein